MAQQHTPEGYARGLLDIVAQAPALHARREAIDLSRKAAGLLMDMAGVGGVSLCADHVGEAVRGLSSRLARD